MSKKAPALDFGLDDTVKDLSPDAEHEDAKDAPKKKRRVYSFRRSERPQAPVKIYKVGFIRVYVAYAVCFVLAAINLFLNKAGFYEGLPLVWQDAAQMIALGVIYVIPAVIFVFATEKTGFKGLAIHRFSPSYFTCIVLGFLVMAVCTATLKFSLAYFFGITGTDAVHIKSGDNIVLAVLTYAVIPAICEELFLRGVLQTEISKKAGGFAGILVSALCFALLHFDFTFFVIYFASGILLAMIRHVCGSILPAFVLHAANNLLSLFFSVQLTFIASEGSGNAFVLVILVFILFLLVLFFLKSLEVVCTKKMIALSIHSLSGKDGDDFKDEDSPIRFYETPAKLYADTGFTFHKTLRVLFSPAIIVTVVLFFMITLL